MTCRVCEKRKRVVVHDSDGTKIVHCDDCLRVLEVTYIEDGEAVIITVEPEVE